jgi:hypothetical protein
MRGSRAVLTSVAGLLLVALLAACTATQTTGTTGTIARSVLTGFWHGFISPIAFIVSIFSEQVRIYACPNAGRWYDLGFMLGIGGLSGGVFSGARAGGRGVGPRAGAADR